MIFFTAQMHTDSANLISWQMRSFRENEYNYECMNEKSKCFDPIKCKRLVNYLPYIKIKVKRYEAANKLTTC